MINEFLTLYNARLRSFPVSSQKETGFLVLIIVESWSTLSHHNDCDRFLVHIKEIQCISNKTFFPISNYAASNWPFSWTMVRNLVTTPTFAGTCTVPFNLANRDCAFGFIWRSSGSPLCGTPFGSSVPTRIWSTKIVSIHLKWDALDALGWSSLL